MALVIPAGFGNILFRFRLDGDSERMVCGFGFSQTVTDTFADMSQAAADISTALQTNLIPAATALIDGWIFEGYEATMETSDQGRVVLEVPVNLIGTFNGNTPPNNFAVLVKKITNTGGRQGRGRIYWPPCNLDETNVNNYGVLDSGYVSGQDTAWNDFLADIQTAGAALYVLHDEDSPVAPPRAITALAVQSKGATQRRRLRP